MIAPSTLQIASPAGPAAEFPGALTARTLRLWCAPEVILAVTDFADEEALLFHAIRQARRSAARVLLVHVLHSTRSSPRIVAASAAPADGFSAQHAQRALERMARQLRWVGIACEPILLRGDAAEEILALAKARAADRVLLTAWRDRSPLARTLAEEVSPWVGVPVCVVGNGGPAALRSERPAGRIGLALSLRFDSETALAFAGRLAQQHHATLTVMHVFGDREPLPPGERTPAAIAARLPAGALREARLLCPLEIAALSGDPAAAILNSEAASLDFLLLGAPRSPYPDRAGAGVVHRVVGQAPCPVLLLGHRAAPVRRQETAPEMSVPA
ncbi:MAG: universal stress protein [Acidobacteriota bacterium]